LVCVRDWNAGFRSIRDLYGFADRSLRRSGSSRRAKGSQVFTLVLRRVMIIDVVSLVCGGVFVYSGNAAPL